MAIIKGIKNPKEPEFRGRWQWTYDEEAFKKALGDQEYRGFINLFRYGRNMIIDAGGVENDS